MSYPIHHLNIALAFESALSQGILKPFARLPQAQNAHPTAIAIRGLLHPFLLSNATIAVADWTPEAKRKLHRDT